MSVHVKVGGVWKTAAAVYNKVGGVWKTASDMPVKVGGVWKTGILASGAFESIASVSATNNTTTTLSFTGLNAYASMYQSLQIRACWSWNNAVSAATVGAYINFNGDTNGANYYTHWIRGNGSSPNASYSTISPASIVISDSVPNDATENFFGAAIIDLTNWNTSARTTVVRAISGANFNTTSTDQSIVMSSGVHTPASAVTSISFTLAGNRTWTNGTTFALYGIKGS
jgi:hypothetical protein